MFANRFRGLVDGFGSLADGQNQFIDFLLLFIRALFPSLHTDDRIRLAALDEIHHALNFLEGHEWFASLHKGRARPFYHEGEKLRNVQNAERGTRTPTPLRALEPESSASANSAISAKA